MTKLAGKELTCFGHIVKLVIWNCLWCIIRLCLTSIGMLFDKVILDNTTHVSGRVNLALDMLGNFECEWQTVWIQIWPNLSGLIRVKTVCKGYQQATLVVKELKKLSYILTPHAYYNL